MKNDNLIRYQTRYLERVISNTCFFLKTNNSGVFELRTKPQKIDYNVFLYGSLGLIGLVFNYIESNHILIYILSATLLLISILAVILGKIRDSYQYFKFDPNSQEIVFCMGLKDKRQTLPTDGAVSYRWEIHEYGHSIRTYSATFYAKNSISNKNIIILQLNSKDKNKCLSFSRAVTRYILEFSDLKDIKLIEK